MVAKSGRLRLNNPFERVLNEFLVSAVCFNTRLSERLKSPLRTSH